MYQLCLRIFSLMRKSVFVPLYEISMYADCPKKGGLITLNVGNGNNTIFGKGKCKFKFKVNQSGTDLTEYCFINLMPTTFPEVYKKEFLKNWKLIKELPINKR